MDDLDELLDEVEKKFCCSVSVAPRAREESREAGQRHGFSATKPDESERSVAEDMDALLEELLEEDWGDAPPLKVTSEAPEPETRPPAPQSAGRKCGPVFIGGSAVTAGVGTATSTRSCDQLRCTSCDFRVLRFDDCEWDSSCDYLFFRNNSPDRQRLRVKLKKRRGFRAFACQCSWFSTLEPTDVRDQPQLSWVCGKHLD